MEAVKAVQQAIDYMEEHLCERMEPNRIAEAALMSLPNLYRVFYALTGHPLMEYIRKRRVNRAAHCLRYSESPILDIAFESGFDSYRTFAAVFKKATGLTPGMYRKASLYYSFERVNLLERVSYLEERELSHRFPDVKVVRLAAQPAIAYRHGSSVREGLEDEAFRLFYKMLASAGIEMERTRLFGFDAPLSDSPSDLHEYVIMAPIELPAAIRHPDLFVTKLPGGLYAEGKAPAAPASAIIAAWNRIVAEWLPRSSFKLGSHPFVEEFFHHRGRITRMKLFLPVSKKHEQETIEVAALPRSRILAFRAGGIHAQSLADDQLTAWLNQQAVVGDIRRSLYMSYSYGITECDDSWYELGIAAPDDIHITGEDAGRVKWLGGGLYASVSTVAYGVMTGVLDLLHEWLCQTDDYCLDETRSWFAEYLPASGPEAERSTTVICYLPVIRSNV
ncbi:helix-turn-helix domain-containing protein [Cohnella kolymensis]|uniref:helix-turn-helix domain-containing protein n=1 Tax=Cohnella kolymensis TaxID=1590652 RepID=UPI00069896B5|nr:helix-turn-helix domain-containing protein [Cohnella kolymensis]